MDKYQVKLTPKAHEDIDDIYSYIADSLKNREVALELIDEFENAIFSLETMPYRGAERKIGMFAEKGYRQLFIGNFTVIYRVSASLRHVIVVRVVLS